MLLSDRAQFDLARRLRSTQGVAVGEAFAFISGLYFRASSPTRSSSRGRPSRTCR